VFNKVVWATDGSKSADEALGLAKTLAEESSGELFAVHCEELGLWGNQAVPAHGHEDKFKEKIEGQVAELSNSGLTATLTLTKSGIGGAAHAIADAAKTLQADVIVTGTRGHTPLAGLVLGSVTERLLHLAPCPLLVVPSKGDGQAA
jgi:nucleotide-binding universal stress UspA family protein